MNEFGINVLIPYAVQNISFYAIEVSKQASQKSWKRHPRHSSRTFEAVVEDPSGFLPEALLLLVRGMSRCTSGYRETRIEMPKKHLGHLHYDDNSKDSRSHD